MGDICYSYVSQPLSWTEARDNCESKNAYLAEPKTKSQNENVNNLRTGHRGTNTWLGAVRGPDDNFQWSHSGDKIGDFDDWGPGEPNNSQNKGQNCTMLFEWLAFTWSDVVCSKKASSICEMVRMCI